MGKNIILKGMNLEKNATTMIRNKLIGGHNGYQKLRSSKAIYGF